MRPEYDFSRGERGVTARKDAQGGNPVVVSLDVLDVFPGVAAGERQRRPVRTTPAGGGALSMGSASSFPAAGLATWRCCMAGGLE